MKVLQTISQVTSARRELERRGVSAIEPRWQSVLRRVGLLRGFAVGDFIKSWDVLETVRFLERLEPDSPILDIGAYSSEILVCLHRAGYRNLFGADLDPRLSLMPYGRLVRYEVCDFMSTPFQDQSFQAITAISVIEHGFESARLLAEVSRLLRPDGYFVVSFDYWQEKIDTSGILFFGMSWRIFSEAEVREFLAEAATYNLFPVDELSFSGSDAFVRARGKHYTFGWLVLQKRL